MCFGPKYDCCCPGGLAKPRCPQARRQAWRLLAELRHHTCPAISLAHLASGAPGPTVCPGSHPGGEPATAQRQLLFSGGTDGGIAIWDVSAAVSAAAERSCGSADSAGGAAAAAKLAPLAVLQGVHQSGVNSLAAAWLPCRSADSAQPAADDAATAVAASSSSATNGVLPAANSAHAACGPRVAILVSGGDDQAVALTVLAVGAGCIAPQPEGGLIGVPAGAAAAWDSSAASGAAGALHAEAQQREAAHIVIGEPWRLQNAHASAVRGVWTDGDAAFSTGLDQRVRRWRIVAEHADNGGGGNSSGSRTFSYASGSRAGDSAASPQVAAESRGRAAGGLQLVEQAAEVVQVLEPSCLAVAPGSGGTFLVAVAGRGLQILTSAPDCATVRQT
jgi:hypothetical protein